jgi:hypothetical protein
MSPRAARIAAIGIALVVACSRLPALFVAAGHAGPDRVFLGYEADAATLVDLHYYASYVYAARESPTVLFVDRATTEPQDGRVLSFYFAALGALSRLFDAPIATVWNAARVVVVLLFFFALWKALGVFAPAAGRRLLAYAWVAFGGGFGWLMQLLRAWLGDHDALALADLAKDGVIGYSTFGYVYHPQALAAEACFLGAVAAWGRYRDTRRTLALVVALLLGAVVFCFHAPSAPVFYAALLAAPFVPLVLRFAAREAWHRARSIGFFAIAALPFVVYLFWARGDPVFRGFAETYAALRHLREPLFWYPVGYGLVLLLAIQGARTACADDPERRDFLLGWFFAAFVLSVNPLLFAWKFQFALHVPLCVLAAHGAADVAARWRGGLRRPLFAGALLVAFSGISSLFLFGQTLARAGHEALFATRAELDALAFLAKQPAGNVLARYRSGGLVISHTPHKAYLAHYTGTLAPSRKDEEVQSFFRAETTLVDKQSLLARAVIRYVYEGPVERKRGGVDPRLGLERIYDERGVRIFRVPSARFARK